MEPKKIAYKCLQLNWIERQTTDLKVESSNLSKHIFKDTARQHSGNAGDCKSLNGGSILPLAFQFTVVVLKEIQFEFYVSRSRRISCLSSSLTFFNKSQRYWNFIPYFRSFFRNFRDSNVYYYSYGIRGSWKSTFRRKFSTL